MCAAVMGGEIDNYKVVSKFRLRFASFRGELPVVTDMPPKKEVTAQSIKTNNPDNIKMPHTLPDHPGGAAGGAKPAGNGK